MSDPCLENKVVVHIFGEEYPITGVLDPSHISRIADYVDKKMNEASAGSRVKSRDRVAILAAMSIASELLELQERLQETGSDADVCAEGILARLDRALAMD
jgi:cell division protein ZapA (FtsZ GTPase activity inhibitor)